ncbi:MAG: Ig-like domain-containing protein [Pseudomonadota bacterium]
MSFSWKYRTYTDFEFTALLGSQILSEGDTQLGIGDAFTMPAGAAVGVTVSDNDKVLSGDSWRNEIGNDRSGQIADIQVGDRVVTDTKIYAEEVYTLSDASGNLYYLVEIEMVGSASGDQDDLYAFYGDVPPAGAMLSVEGVRNVFFGARYDALGAGDPLGENQLSDGSETSSAQESSEGIPLDNVPLNTLDPEAGEPVVASVSGSAENLGAKVAGSGGGLFTISADGTASFDANGDFEDLAKDETRQTSVTYTVTDADGTIVESTYTVTVVGENDAPVIGAALVSGFVTEDAGSAGAPGFGALANVPGLLPALDQIDPAVFTSALDFGLDGFGVDDFAQMATGAEALFLDSNEGASGPSEALALDVLARLTGASLAAVGAEITYSQAGAQTDFAVTVDGEILGVSVTRGFAFQSDLSVVGATGLLTDALEDIQTSSANAVQPSIDRQVLVVFAEDTAAEMALETAIQSLEPAVLGDTITLIVRTDGNDGTLYGLEDIGDAGSGEVARGPEVATGAIAFSDKDLSDTHSVTVAFKSSTFPMQLGAMTVVLSDPATGGETGSATWTFEIDNDDIQFLGSDETIVETYTVSITDSAGETTTQDVEIEISGSNDAPIAEDLTLNQDTAPEVTGQLVATDIDGDTLVFSKASDPTNGTLDLNVDGSFVYTPGESFGTSDSFTYLVSDGMGGTDSATVTINLTPAGGQGFGELSTIPALPAALSEPDPALFVTNLDFGSNSLGEEDLVDMAPGAAVLYKHNGGGGSALPEALALDVLARVANAELAAAGSEIDYDLVGPQTDFAVTVDGEILGVSVTRGFDFFDSLTVEQATVLLEDSYEDVLASTNAVADDLFDRQILVVFAEDQVAQSALQTAANGLDPVLVADTLTLIVTTDGDDGSLFGL